MLEGPSMLSIILALGCISLVCSGGKHAVQAADKQL